MARFNIPRITYGNGTVIQAGLPLDNVTSYPEPREGSVFSMAPSGIEDAWYLGDDQFLEGDWRFIPTVDSLFPYPATGWDSGVRQWLSFARQKQTFRFYPDSRNLVSNPTMTTDTNSDGLADDWYTLGGPGMGIQTSEGAQRLDINNPYSSDSFYTLNQGVYGIQATEVITLSVETRFTLTNGGQTYCDLQTFDGNGTNIGELAMYANVGQTTYTRIAITCMVPTNTVRVGVMFGVRAHAGTTGQAYFRNAMLERAASPSPVFIDSPYNVCYLNAPMNGAPTIENDGTRTLKLRLRDANQQPFTGY